MNKAKQLWRVASHPRELRMALSGLGMRLGGDTALGGLTDEETEGVVRWVKASGVKTFVEIGTLFGFTAKAVAQRTSAHVVAVDVFCWNPFGLPPAKHEAFTRRILAPWTETGKVALVKSDSKAFRDQMAAAAGAPIKQSDNADNQTIPRMVFLDADHSYEAVRDEIAWAKSLGVKTICGHDYGNPLFGVTRAVDEAFPQGVETAGMCWKARIV